MGVIAAVGRFLRHPALRRRLPALGDQAASSLSNTLVFIMVARSFDSAAAVGAFGLAMVVYAFLMGGFRAVLGETLLSLYAPASSDERRELVADVLGACLLLSAICSVVLWPISVWVGGLSGSALLALVVVLPLVMIQDVWRWLFIIDRPMAALVIDLVWLVAVVGALLAAPADASVGWFVVVWGLTGGLSALSALFLDARPRGVPHPWRWLVGTRSTGSRYFGDFLVARGVSEIALSGLGAIAGLGALGAAKASLVYYGPLNTLHAGVAMSLIPEGARLRSRPARLRKILTLASGSMVALGALWMVVGIAVPDDWGQSLFGVVWADGQGLMVPMGLAMIAGGVASGATIGLRSLGDPRRILNMRIRSAPWQLLCPFVGAALADAEGFAVGFAMGRMALAVAGWQAFGQALREREEPTVEDAPAGRAAQQV